VAAVHRYGTGVQVAAVVGAEVVTAAGEAPHSRGGCLRWQDRQCHLPPDLWLFGFNGLVVSPIGRMGRGPFRSGVHAEMIAAAWRVVGAEVAATAGADVVASAGEPPGASYPAALTGVEVVHTCRVEIELGLHLKTDVILSLFCKVLKSTIC
jgi:hypothetical protein